MEWVYPQRKREAREEISKEKVKKKRYVGKHTTQARKISGADEFFVATEKYMAAAEF